MSLPLHPDWHATDTDEFSVPVHTSKQHTDTIHRYAIRHPAAIIGVLLVMGLGMVFVQGVQELRGQVGSTPVTIRIGPAGLDPLEVSVSPGQTVIWQNEQDVPHILTSDALPVEGGTLYTPHILPGTDFSARIAPDAEPGTFTYVSLTAEDIAGTITIASPPAASPLNTTQKPPSPMRPLLPPPPAPLSPATPINIPRPLAPLASIPRNPYALEGTPLPPSSLLPLSAPSSPSQAIPIPPITATVRPFAQPQTGPRGIGAALLIAITGVVGICLYLRKKSSKTLLSSQRTG